MVKRSKITIFITTFVIFLNTIFFNSSAFSQTSSKLNSLKIPNGWSKIHEHVTPLILEYSKNNLGACVYITLQKYDSREIIDVIICEGAGFGDFVISDEKNNDKGILPANSDYEIIKILDYKAIIERHEFLPLALAVNIDKDTKLVCESASVNESDLIRFSEAFINLNF